VSICGKTKLALASSLVKMSVLAIDTSNRFFTLAADLVNQTDQTIFLTGKAGTGKTTFLKYIREHCIKQMAIVAPTGVAAINAGGVTIHSFFQLPLAPFIPVNRGQGFSPTGQEISNPNSLVSRLRFNGEKKKLLNQLELLVIDEISMVRADILDAIDTVLRHVRHKHNERFGGVQLLFIGDMFQLPPVVKEPEWSLLSPYYTSPYFFDSQVLKEAPPLYIEFDKIYRQREADFINLLNQVRNNELNAEGKAILDSRFQPSFRRTEEDGYIILTTHNEQARSINNQQLQQLTTPAVEYEAELENDFPSNAFPADQVLVLKEGAQVMFIRNDSSEKGKRYFNGKIGTVTRLEDKKIFVRCANEDDEIEVVKDTWDNIRYSLDKASQSMKEERLGSFTQFPLRLAWAITIHKSQGLTFEKAIIDAGEAFAAGQVYVALSRCTSLSGMILKSKVRTNSLFTDPRILDFTRNSVSVDLLQTALGESKRAYQLKMLKKTFDFSGQVGDTKELKKLIMDNQGAFTGNAKGWTEDLLIRLNQLQDTAQRFHQWLDIQFGEPVHPEDNNILIERLEKAAAHFSQEAELLIIHLSAPGFVTDSRQYAKEVNDQLKNLFSGLSLSLHLFRKFDGNLEAGAWQTRRRTFILPMYLVNIYAGVSEETTESNPHPELYRALKKQRDQFCAQKDQPVYLVASSHTLGEMCLYLPQDLKEMRKISGMGVVRTEQYGRAFLDIILEYCQEHGLESQIHTKTEKRDRLVRKKDAPQKGDSHRASFDLFRKGHSLKEIAEQRKLAQSTIEGHLTRFVASGDIDIATLISPDKMSRIEAAISQADGYTLAPLKQTLGDDVSFTEIRWVLAAKGLDKINSADQ
jgi:hypothetical protein